jgi:hypothetical protein
LSKERVRQLAAARKLRGRRDERGRWWFDAAAVEAYEESGKG